jgi:hypothetical protein
MNEDQVQHLKNCLAAGLLVWWWNGDGWLIVSCSANDRRCEREDDSEPGPVAYLNDGEGGYAALDADDRNDFMVTSSNLWRRRNEDYMQPLEASGGKP